MLDFIVLGQIPGTQAQIDFTLYSLGVVVILLVFSLVRYATLRKYSKVAKQLAIELISL